MHLMMSDSVFVWLVFCICVDVNFIFVFVILSVFALLFDCWWYWCYIADSHGALVPLQDSVLVTHPWLQSAKFFYSTVFLFHFIGFATLSLGGISVPLTFCISPKFCGDVQDGETWVSRLILEWHQAPLFTILWWQIQIRNTNDLRMMVTWSLRAS